MMNTEVLGYIGTQFSEIPMYSNQQKYDILVCPGVCNPILWPLQNGKRCRYTNGFEVYTGFGQSYINRNTLPTNLGGELVKLDQFYLGFTQFVERSAHDQECHNSFFLGTRLIHDHLFPMLAQTVMACYFFYFITIIITTTTTITMIITTTITMIITITIITITIITIITIIIIIITII